MASKQQIIDELSQRAAYWQECLDIASELEQGRAYIISPSAWGETVGVLRAFNLESVRFEVIASHSVYAQKYHSHSTTTTTFKEFPRDELPTLVGFPHKGPLFKKILSGTTRVKFKGE